MHFEIVMLTKKGQSQVVIFERFKGMFALPAQWVEYSHWDGDLLGDCWVYSTTKALPKEGVKCAGHVSSQWSCEKQSHAGEPQYSFGQCEAHHCDGSDRCPFCILPACNFPVLKSRCQPHSQANMGAFCSSRMCGFWQIMLPHCTSKQSCQETKDKCHQEWRHRLKHQNPMRVLHLATSCAKIWCTIVINGSDKLDSGRSDARVFNWTLFIGLLIRAEWHQCSSFFPSSTQNMNKWDSLPHH